MNMKLEQTMEEFLSPSITRTRLISASIYIAAFESLKESIVGKIRFFYCLDDEETSSPCKKYKKEVMSRNTSVVYASLDWFKENRAIDEADLIQFENIKKCRNELSHRLFSLIGSRGLPQDFEINFHALVELLHKIDLWWVMNIEIPTDPDYSGQEIDEKEVKVGSVMALQMLWDIALGEKDVANSYYEAYRNAQVKNNG